jgi:hypothetical protein
MNRAEIDAAKANATKVTVDEEIANPLTEEFACLDEEGVDMDLIDGLEDEDDEDEDGEDEDGEENDEDIEDSGEEDGDDA